MLELLLRYAREHALVVEPGFEPKLAEWVLDFSKDGRFLTALPLGDTKGGRPSGREYRMCPALSFSEKRGGGMRPRSHFLLDTLDVVAGLGVEKLSPKDQRVFRAKQEYFVKLLTDASAVMPELGPLADVLNDAKARAAICVDLDRQKANPKHKATISIDNRFPVDCDRWHDWWRSYLAGLVRPAARRRDGGEERESPCLATGKLVAPEPIHLKVQGLGDVGGIASGDVLAGFKQRSFRSYGLHKASNASVSKTSVAAYRAALNHILKHSAEKIAGAKIGYWFKKKVQPENDPLWFLKEREETEEVVALGRAGKLLEAVRSGEGAPEMRGNHFYAIMLSGNSGRVIVRDWIEGPFETLAANVARWFEDLQIVNHRGTHPAKAPSLERAITCLLPLPPIDKKKDWYSRWIKPIGGSRLKFWHAAIRGDAMPFDVVPRIVAKIRDFHLNGEWEDAVRADGHTRRNPDETFSTLQARMAVLKAYFRRKGDPDMKCEMNPDHPHPAYHCGRIVAVLAELQKKALGTVGAGVIQRYYGAASTAPALVLGRLVKYAQYHLAQIESEDRRCELDVRLAAIWGRIRDRLPRTLDLEEQGLFALGYYHQRAKDAPESEEEES